MDPATLAILGGAAVVNAMGSYTTAEANRAHQADANRFNRQMVIKTMEREDNAVQRRVADLKAAGLSPVLAAGSAAQAGAPTKIDPIQVGDITGMQGLAEGASIGAKIGQSIVAQDAARAQINLTNAQTLKTATETGVVGKELGLYDTSGGHPKYQDTWGKRLTEIVNGAKSIADGIPKVKDAAQNYAEREVSKFTPKAKRRR